MSEKFAIGKDKLDKETKKKLYKRLEETKAEIGKELKVEETPDMIAVELESEDGRKKKRWFMKSEELSLDGKDVKIEDFIEASIKFPDVSLAEAARKQEILLALRKFPGCTEKEAVSKLRVERSKKKESKK